MTSKDYGVHDLETTGSRAGASALDEVGLDGVVDPIGADVSPGVAVI